jgi:16S rRNA (adenine1518-N6/adenine1519-N6)-dimethyltransferase
MKLSEMKQILTEKEIQLTKSLGQNFLHDRNQLLRIAAAADLQSTDQILEIGPGLGPLTELLIERASEVFAIEKDLRLVEILKQRFGEKLNLLHDDALDYLRRESRDWTQWKLVSNLPYSVASPILVELAQAPQPPERMVATLQSEVAQRLMAPSGSRDYGVLTLLVQLHFQPRETFKIPAVCFFPEPDVASTCVVLIRRPQPLFSPNLREVFNRIVKRSFSQRRKMMLKLLKQDWPAEKLEAAFAHSKLSNQVRAEAVPLEQFVGLTRFLADDS